MVKCPFCGFGNEDGALFCEQCKSDVSSVAPEPAALPLAPATAEAMPAVEVAMAAPLDDALVMAALVEETPVAVALVDEAPVEEVAAAVIEEAPTIPPAEEAPAIPLVEEVPMAAESAIVVETPAPAPVEAAPVSAEIPAAAVSAPPAAPAAAGPFAAGAQIKLTVMRGLKIGEEYPVYPGENYIGRADDKPVDIDLVLQEPEDRVWCSRQHAVLMYDDAAGTLTVEDLNSSNGTFVNRERVYPGQPRQLVPGNTIQIGTVHLKVKV